MSNGNGEFARCGGAEKHGARWRVVKIRADGSREHQYFSDEPGATAEQQARAFVVLFRERQGRLTKTLGQLVNEFCEHRKVRGDRKGRKLKPGSVRAFRGKLVSMLQLAEAPDRLRRGRRRISVGIGADRPIASVTPAVAARLYRERAQVAAAATHHGELVLVKAMFAFAVERGEIKSNPFAGVHPDGEQNKGKRTLRMDEARKFIRACYADPHPIGGAAAAAVFQLGIRSAECLQREVRDLDDRGRVLCVDTQAKDSSVKTKKSERRVTLPPRLRALLAGLVAGKGATDRIFGTMAKATLWNHVKRLCEVAGVPVVCVHGLRDTFAELTVEVEGDLAATSRHLGHSNTRVTREHYVSWSALQTSKAALLEAKLFEEELPEESEIDRAEREALEAIERLNRLRAEVGTVQIELGTKPNSQYPAEKSIN